MFTDTALYFVDIFNKINRRDQLLGHYYKCRLVPLEQLWNAFDKQSQSPLPDEKTTDAQGGHAEVRAKQKNLDL
jgi:hypothetical protein